MLGSYFIYKENILKVGLFKRATTATNENCIRINISEEDYTKL